MHTVAMALTEERVRGWITNALGAFEEKMGEIIKREFESQAKTIEEARQGFAAVAVTADT